MTLLSNQEKTQKTKLGAAPLNSEKSFSLNTQKAEQVAIYSKWSFCNDYCKVTQIQLIVQIKIQIENNYQFYHSQPTYILFIHKELLT